MRNDWLRALHWGSATTLLGLIGLTLAWEAWLVPSSRVLLMLKAVPLLLPLFGVLHGRRYTFQWSSMMILLYFTEGVVRAWSEQGVSAALAGGEIALSLTYFLCAIFYARLTRRV